MLTQEFTAATRRTPRDNFESRVLSPNFKLETRVGLLSPFAKGEKRGIFALAVTLIVASLFLSPTNVGIAAAAAGNDPGVVNFEMHCATCHAPNGSGDTAVGKSIKIPDLRSPAVQSLPEVQLVDVIANGKGPMPGFKSSLSKDEIDALVNHVHQLAKTK